MCNIYTPVEVLEGPLVGRKACVTSLPSPGRLRHPRCCLGTELAQCWSQTHLLELAQLVQERVANSDLLFQLQPASGWIPAQSLQHPPRSALPRLGHDGRSRWSCPTERTSCWKQNLPVQTRSPGRVGGGEVQPCPALRQGAVPRVPGEHDWR